MDNCCQIAVEDSDKIGYTRYYSVHVRHNSGTVVFANIDILSHQTDSICVSGELSRNPPHILK